MDRTDDNTPQFYSSRQNALPRPPTSSSDNSPQPSLVSQSGNIVPKSTNLSQNKGESMNPSSHLAADTETLQKVPSFAEFTRMALSSNDSHGVTGDYPDAASNRPSRTTDPRLTDYPPSADLVAESTRRERTSKSRKDMSRSRSGQPLTSVDNVHGVAAPPISSKSSSTFTSKEVPTSSQNVPLTRASQATGTDPSVPLGTEELGKRNRSPLTQADSAREGNTAKPLAQVVDRTPSVHPKPSTHSAPTLNQPSVSTSSHPSHVAPTIPKATSSRTRTARSKRPNESHEDAHTGGTPPELPPPPDKDKGKARSNERSHAGPSAPAGTPPLPPEHPASAAGSPSRPQPESGPQGLDRSTSRIRGNEGVGREARRVAEGLASAKGETRPGPILPSKSMQSAGQPYSAAAPPVPQKGTHTKSPPETGDDTPSGPPGDRRRGETHVPSLAQLGPPQEAVGNKPHVKPSDQIGHTQSPAPPIFKVSSNIGKERGSQPQHGLSISQPQHSQTESSGMVPNQHHRTDPLMTRETGLPSSGHAAIGVPSFPHFRPVIAYVPVHPDEVYNPERSPPLPPYELGPPAVPVPQEGAPSRSGARIPSGVRDEPKKLPASLVLEAPRNGDDQGHMDRPEELKRLLLPTRGDAVAAVCPPPDREQSVEVHRQMTPARGVRQLAALSSPKIQDRSRSDTSFERGNEAIKVPHAPQERHDLPITGFRRVAGSRGTRDSFGSDDRGLGLWEMSEGSEPPERNGHGPQEQDPSRPSVPQVAVIPPTRPTSLHITPEAREQAATPPERPRPASKPQERPRPAPTPPTQPSGPPRRGSRPEISPVRKKGILSRICPCLG